MTTEITILPEEIRSLAEQVEESKKNEIAVSMQTVFASQNNLLSLIESFDVTSIDQVDEIKKAKEIRLEAKRKRLEVEKILDFKRAEVQNKMSAFKTEDALYLKTKQVIQIKYKHIEELAEFKEKFVERYNKEQKELKFSFRSEKLSKFQVDTTFINLREMSDSDFEIFYQNQEKIYNEKLEAERIRKEQEELKAKLETQRLELERIEREKQLEEERKQLEAKRIEREKQEEAARIEREKQLAIEREIAAKNEAELKAANEKLKAEREQAELQRIAREKELEAEHLRIAQLEAERQKQIDAERLEAERLAKLDDSGKLKEFLNQLERIDFPECKSKKNKEIIEAAKDRITKICDYLKSEML